jgi:stage II sporulation protein R
MKKYIFLTALLLTLLIGAGCVRESQEALAERISPAVLRLHILADSDKKNDQAVKLEVRSLVLDLLREQFPENADKKDTVDWIRSHRTKLEAAADALLHDRGFPYQAKLTLVHDYFPARAYGQLSFPCGYYDAVRIVLGSGRGHNWWCILYPQFCFLEGVCTEIPDDSMDVLKQKISQDDLLRLEVSRPDFSQWNRKHPEVQIRFRLFRDIPL